MANANATLIGTPIFSDDGVVYTPSFSGGGWSANLPSTNLKRPDISKAARSSSAALADTRVRVDLGADRPVRVIGLVYRSPERTGAPTTTARVRYLGFAVGAQDVLFDVEAGYDVVSLGGTFTRASTATYIDAGGVLRTAASGVIRDAHFVGGVRTELLEAASTNLALQSENFGTTWVAVGTPTRVAAAHTASGITLDLIGDDTVGAIEGYTQVVTFTGNAVKSVSIALKAGTATKNVVRLRDTTAGANRILGTVSWSGGVPSVAMTTGMYLGAIALADGVYRLLFIATSVTAANTNQIEVYPAADGAVGGFDITLIGTVYAGGVQAEDAASPTSYIKTTTVTVARAADSLSFPTVASNGTIYQKYWDLATLAYVESTLAYTSGAAIPFTTGRAYVSTRIASGTQSQAYMQALVFDSGWLTPFPASKTIEDTEGENLGAWCVLAVARTLRYVSVQIDDSLNAAGFVDINRLVVAGGIQPPTNTVVGGKLGLETATVNTDGDLGVTSALRKPTRRNATVGYDEQTDDDALSKQFEFQRVAGTSRQLVFVWDPTDTTYLHQRTFLATLQQLSQFEANVGNRWVIPYVFREVL